MEAILRVLAEPMSREAFGPGLRRIRLQRGVSIETIAEQTRVSAELWHSLERNDLSRWPTGIFARAYIRQYAEAIGIDPDATVDEFCRWFSQGDRRAGRIVRGQAELIGHQVKWKDDLVGLVVEGDRRSERTASANDVPPLLRSEVRRVIAAVSDAAAVLAAGFVVAALVPVGRMTAVAVCALTYHALSLTLLGCSPSVWVLDTYVISRHPRAGNRRFLRLVRNSVRVKV
jgi:transcriptional regulator with XRE-family HTH domain